MARKFVRNITGTQLRGSKKEPLKTNTQNDILSDGEDVFIRNQNEYHCLTDNLKRITVPEDNDTIKIVRVDKNTIEIIGNKQDIPDIPDIPEPIKLVSESEKLIVEKISENNFKLLLDLSDYYTKSQTDSEISNAISKIPEVDLSNFYTKSQTDSEISNAINEIPEVDVSNFYTKEQVDEQFIALEIPDVSQFLTSEQIQVLIDTAVSELDFDVDLSNYYTKKQTNDTFKTNPLNEDRLPELSENQAIMDFNAEVDYWDLWKNNIFTVQIGADVYSDTYLEIDFSTLKSEYYHIPLFISNATDSDDIITINLKFRRSKTYQVMLNQYEDKIINIYIMDEAVFIDDKLTAI